MEYIGLADCNNFFVSCERVFRPDLADKPVVVLSSNDGAIVARSNEVKELGVPMGVPYFKVRDVFQKNGVAVFSSNFDLYRDMSRRVMKVLRDELCEIEQYSVDEAFFKINVVTKDAAEAELLRLRELVRRCVGIPMSFGLAPSKTIAKFAGEQEKRGTGVCVLTKDDWLKRVNEVQLSELWGVGGAMSKKLRAQGLVTVSDLLNVDQAQLAKVYGLFGVRLRNEISGCRVKDRAERDDLPKSIMSTRSFAKTTNSFSVLAEALAYHVARAAEELRAHRAVAEKISVMILTNRHTEWVLQGGGKETMLTVATNDTTVLLREALKLARDIYDPTVPYKKSGVVLSLIRPAEKQQMDLFGMTDMNNEKLSKTIDGLNRKLGIDSVTIGRTKFKSKSDNRHDYRSPRYSTNWNEIPKIK